VVYVDGLRVGTSPGSVHLRRGIHLVWSGAPAHTADVRVISLEAGSRSVHEAVLVAEPIDASLRALRTELLGQGRADVARAAAQSLAKDVGASGVVVSAVAPGPDAPVLFVAFVDDRGARVGASSFNQDAEAAALVALLVASPPHRKPVFRLSDAARSSLALDFEKRLLGAAPTESVTEEDSNFFASPLLWGAIGASVLLASSAVTAAVLLQPEPVVKKGPAQTRVLVEAVP
jgi:hypothetical protein